MTPLNIWQFIQISSYLSPKVIGSGFRVQACPGATGCGYAIVFSVYDFLAFHHCILRCQVWARGSKVVICWHPSLYNTILRLASLTHWVKDTRCPYWGIILIDMSLLALFNPEPWTLNCWTQVSSKTSGLLWPLRKSSAFFILYPRCSDSNPSNTCNKCHMSRAGTLTPSLAQVFKMPAKKSSSSKLGDVLTAKAFFNGITINLIPRTQIWYTHF